MMKKWISAVCIAILAFSLFGCSSKEETAEAPISTKAEIQEATTPVSAPVKEEKSKTQGTLKVHYIDVGQGDSEFIELPDGKTMLIDAGEADEAGKVIGYIDSLGYTKIDYLLATHPHADHIGGLPAVINKYEIGEIWAPKASHTTQTFKAFLDAVQQKGLTINAASAGKRVYNASGCTVDILHPTATAYDDLNDWSIINLLKFGDSSFLFTGDAGAAFISSACTETIDVLKVGHHGSDISTTAALLSQLVPATAIISCGAGNSYGHPTDAVLSALSSLAVYRTDLDGTIMAISNGKTIDFEKGKTAPVATVAPTFASEPTPEPEVVPAPTSETEATIVYCTDSGERYHLGTCRHLNKSKHEITLENAKARGLTPCKTCNPPA